MSLSLGEQQRLFGRLLGPLLVRIYLEGYEVSLGWAYRPKGTGVGIKGSLHTVQLAIDLNLFKDGVWLKDTESHRPIGEWWEKQHPLCRWGGRFGDGNHYSLERGGVK